MVHGNLANGDYFIDVSSISQSTLRSIFGVWVNICVAVIAFCLRSSYRSSVIKKITSHNPRQPPVSLWGVSPPVIPSEVFQQRLVLLHYLAQGKFAYVVTSLACVIAAIVSAGSTTIANHAVVKNNVVREGVVPGILVTREHNTLQGNVVRMTALVQALEGAGAPHDQLFDFIPQQQSHWLFDTKQWNNSWVGNCTFQVYPAVDLTVLPSTSENYQDEVPGLASCLPEWATQDPSKQGVHYAGFYENVGITNSTGNWRDLLVTYSFGSTPSEGVRNSSTVNIAFVNFLAHNVGRSLAGQFVQTGLKSDVNVASCTFDNTTPGATDQAKADGGNYGNVAQNIGNMYLDYVLAISTAGGQVIQPTGEQMVRYYQAFMAAKDSTNVHPVQRALSVSQPTVQIRLSALLATIVPFLAALAFAALAHITEPRDSKRKRFKLPGSQFDWIVQAAREYFRGDDTIMARSSSTYAQQRKDLSFGFVERSGHGRAIGQIQAVPICTHETVPKLGSDAEEDSTPGPTQ